MLSRSVPCLSVARTAFGSQGMREAIAKGESGFTRTAASNSLRTRSESADKKLVSVFVLAHAPGLRVFGEVVLWLRRLIGPLLQPPAQLNWEFVFTTVLGQANVGAFQTELRSSDWKPSLLSLYWSHGIKIS